MVQHRLDTITRHMGWVMTRTARSPIFSQSHDFSCFLCAADGTLVSCADGIPIHTGGGGFAVRAMRAAFTPVDGDVYLANDPYLAGGNHLPDWVVARPVFVAGALVGFCCNRAHQSDIGGGAAGTYNPAATEIYHEGIRLPPLRLVAAGETRDDLWQLLLANSRTPELLDGDLRAMIGSTRIGAERLADLVAEVEADAGPGAFAAHVDGVLDHAERRFRAALGTLPPGRYEGEEVMDNDCFEALDVPIRVALSVEPDGRGLTVDFTGSAAQIRGFKNSSPANTASAVYVALASFFEPDIPRNEGTFRAVRIVAPYGSIVNPRPPAPLTMCTVFCAQEIIHAVWKALAQADPARACAGWGKSVHGITAGAREDGRPFVLYHWHGMAGAGATAERDGFEQLGHLIALGGLAIPDLEVYEQQFPVRYRRWELRCDAAGPGRRRGGSGVHYEADVLAGGSWSFRGEGVGTPSSWGANGGGGGAPGSLTLRSLTDPDEPPFHAPKYGLRSFGPVRVEASTPGGGGWGDPFTRPASEVLRDVADGVVSVEGAARDYGVVAGADGGLDEEATATRRRRAR
jgi:N-methylhydantoinase B